jgi:N-acetylmuramoyl-L-alanine amidase
MRPRAKLLLHVATVTAGVAASMAVPALVPARAATPSGPPPPPYVVVLDPGHGGTPDNAHPEILFDPGSIASSGLMEKDVTLRVARAVKKLLEKDGVKVLLTRNGDTFVDISPRMEMANQARASLFVSIHFNAFTDPAVKGSVVLYPNDGALPFAQVMSGALGARLGRLGFVNHGVLPKGDLWVHAQMPAVTVEPAYLSNDADAAQVARASVQDAIAAGIRDGIEIQEPGIMARKAQVAAYQSAQARAVTHHSDGGLPLLTKLLPNPLLIAAALVLVALALVYRRGVLAGMGLAAGVALSLAGPRRSTARYPRRRRPGAAARPARPVLPAHAAPRRPRSVTSRSGRGPRVRP